MSLSAGSAEAQWGRVRRLIGAPVAAEAVHARFVFGMSGNRIIVINQADEVYYHRVHGNRVDMHIRMQGQTVGHRGDPTVYVVPEDNDSILVLTRRGELFRHDIRAETVSPPMQIPGAPVGTQGQDPVFMFMMGNNLINATRQGEIWAHTIGRTVMPPRRIGRYQLQAPRVVRHVVNIGRQVFVVVDDGVILQHDINPELGVGRAMRGQYVELAAANTRFAFLMGTRVYAVDVQGGVWYHDVTPIIRAQMRGRVPPGQVPPGQVPPGQAPPGQPAQPAPAQPAPR
jgi:hypothetical protein